MITKKPKVELTQLQLAVRERRQREELQQKAESLFERAQRGVLIHSKPMEGRDEKDIHYKQMAWERECRAVLKLARHRHTPFNFNQNWETEGRLLLTMSAIKAG